MTRRRRKVLPQGTFDARIERLSHDGRGVAHLNGKITFIEAALPGEQVRFEYSFQRSQFDEGFAVEVENAAPERVKPPCEFAQLCGGCSLQHMSNEQQIALKENTLKDQFKHIAGMEIPDIFPALRASTLHYRRKARLGVKYVAKKEKVLVGFREKRSNFLADINRCEVLVKEVGHKLDALAELISTLDARAEIPQIEIAKGDDSSVALVFRHLKPLSDSDFKALGEFCLAHDFHLYLQAKGPESVYRVALDKEDASAPAFERLYYRLPNHQLNFAFHPADFTQVNGDINRLMIERVLALLAPNKQDVILDLFCGLGNFSLPLARYSQAVVGIEGSEVMVQRALENAQLNELDNCEFYSLDLTRNLRDLIKDPQASVHQWVYKAYNKLLIDPPRSGAQELLECIDLFKDLRKVVYVSCNLATLARDSAILVSKGFKLQGAGVMDMFPHTNHVESLAVFEKV
jgi:23S rRNA (uracil1939-C5)-methyltransferase